MKPDLYKILGVPRDSDRDTIKRAHRRKAKKAHPDAGGDRETFLAVQLAYETLTDETKRERYDSTGSTDSPRSVHARAMSELVKMAIGIAENTDVATTNGVDGMRQIVQKMILQANQARGNALARAAKLRKAAARYKSKETVNPFKDVLENEAEKSEEQARNIAAHSEVTDEMGRILDGTSYECDEAKIYRPTGYGLSGSENLINALFGGSMK